MNGDIERMNFRDRKAKDESGNEFIFTVEMQRRLSQAGLPLEPAYLSQLGDFAAPPTLAERPPRPERRERVERPSPSDHHSPAKAPADDVSETTVTFDEPFTVQIDPQTGKYIGRLKWYNPKKGYGFLMRGGGEEIFFHKSSTIGPPESFDEGQWVLYDVEETRKGPEAMDIEPYTGDVSLIE
jgi:cold shock CspA family protein